MDRIVEDFHCEQCGAIIGQEHILEGGKRFLESPGVILFAPVGILVCSACGWNNPWTIVGRLSWSEYCEHMRPISGEKGKKR